MQKIDVIINVFGKPWQTLVSLKTLLKHSSDYIDKIYFIEEPQQPNGDNVSWVVDELNYKNTVHFKPKYSLWINGTDRNRYVQEEEYMMSLRYEYGIRMTDKKYVMIIHNDVLFTSDIIQPFINNINGGFGIGLIGQCWNCPLFHETMCDGSKYNSVNHNYMEVMRAVNKHPQSRTFIFQGIINQNNPKPMPECRINEWCCLIDADLYKQNVIPNGNVLPFGGYFKVDLADAWFEGMVNNGYKAEFYNIYQNMKHGYFEDTKPTPEYCLNSHNGHSALFNQSIYLSEEEQAKIIYNKLKYE